MSQPEAAVTARHERLTRLRAERRRVPDAQVIDVLGRLERSGLPELVEPWLRRERGRPATLSARALLTGMFLTAQHEDGRTALTAVTDMLYFEISPGMRTRLDLHPYPDTDIGFEAAYAVVRRLFHKLAKACDPSPLPKNKRLDKQQAAALQAAADPNVLARNRARLVRMCGLIIEDSLEPVRDLLAEHWDGSGAVDGTAVRAYSKGLRSKGPVTSTDPDAAWHVRTGDHADPDDGKPTANKNTRSAGRRAQYKYAYEATLVTARNPARDGTPRPDGTPDPSVIPALVLGFSLDKPGNAPGTNAITALSDVRRRGHPAGWMAGDRLFNNSEPEHFQLPLRALGYRPVFDYASDQTGIQTEAHGALQVEGSWYCPSMATALIETTRDLAQEIIDPTTWAARIQARRPYRLYPKQRPDTEGHQRLMCPAAAGKVLCPLKPALLARSAGRRLPLVDPEPSPADPPPICTQASITLPPEAGAKHAQDLSYGTAEWSRIYFRLRNAVEGTNGFIKDPAHEVVEAGATRRIRGIAPQAILLAFQLAHANIRKIQNWIRTLPGEHGEPPRRRPTRRRKTRPLGSWTPAGQLSPDQPKAA